MSVNPQQDYPMTGTYMSEAAYFALDDSVPDVKYEFEDGIVRMMSGGSVAHDEITANVRQALKTQLATGPCTALGPNMRTEVAPGSKYYYLDVVVSCDVADRRRDNKVIRAPRIVVEVLSPSTEPEDRGRKLRAYQACATIQEYMLLSQFAEYVEVYRRGADGTWMQNPQVYGPLTAVRLESIDVTIPIGEFYDSINFAEEIEG